MKSKEKHFRLRTTGLFFTTFILFWTILFQCRKDDRAQESSPDAMSQRKEDLSGIYLILPSFHGERVEFLEENRLLYRTGQEQAEPLRGYYTRDEKMIKIYIDGKMQNGPTGLFLLSDRPADFSRTAWKGFWLGDVRSLKPLERGTDQ